MNGDAEQVFWRDLADDMCDPEFRAAFERTWSEMHGWQVDVHDTSDDTTVIGNAADHIANRLEH